MLGPMSTVLVVDDDPALRYIAVLSLQRIGGLTVIAAASGEAAIALAIAEQPAAILLDVMMPILDGPATLARLRANPGTARIPVVFLTAKVQPSEVVRLLALGALGVIAKPFDPVELPAELRRFLVTHQSSRPLV